MEKLKSLVPENLKRKVAESDVSDLPSTSSSLLEFLLSLPQFRQMVRDLAEPERGLCAKSKVDALKLKQKGNDCYASGDYAAALASYSQALRVAPKDAADMGKNLVATLFLNRATLLHKMGLSMECLRDCDRALQISPSYAKAWFRRAKANIAMGNYKAAVNDLNVAKHEELSLGGKKQIESELKIIVELLTNTGTSPVRHKDNQWVSFGDLPQMKLSSVTTLDKGRGMVSTCDIPQASLVHKEEPYALIISKSSRETHCHFCLNELPVDTVPCISCSITLYCSQNCQMQGGGETFSNCLKKGPDKSYSGELEEYISEVTLCSDSDPGVNCVHEHKHECLGVNWPAILPSEVVLAGRMLLKSVSQRKSSMESNFLINLDLSHNYSQISPESKLELHIYAIVLLSCLEQSIEFGHPLNGVYISQTIILLSQIRVNSMAIVRMRSVDFDIPSDQLGKLSRGGALTTTVEQVPVGQAIYLAGSLFNHSCQPNINAYFLSRSVFLRTTEFVATGCPLELSYGPQVGQWDCKERLKFLEDKYAFQCQCRGCSELNPSDLVLNAFCCINPNCAGVVLDSYGIDCEIPKLKKFPQRMQNLEQYLLVGKVSADDTSLGFGLELRNNSPNICPGCCLKCGSLRDLESSCETVNKARICIERLKNAVTSKDISSPILMDAARGLDVLRAILHAYNRGIAEAEDNLAEAFCLIGDLQSATDHCKASIKILETLYGADHIVIGYELVKLSTIQLSVGDRTAVDSINKLEAIFLRYYGSHTEVIFPYLLTLKREACKLTE